MVEFNTILQFIQAAGIIVGVAYYVLNIENNRKSQELTQRNQELTLETRQAQLFMNIYNITIDEEMNKKWYDAMEMSVEHFHEVRVTMHTLFQKYNGIGHLMMQGLLDVESAYHYSEGYRAVLLWLKWGDHVKGARSNASNPDYMDGFQYMAEQMMEYREEKGLPNKLLPRFNK